MLKVLNIVGARPNFMKVAPIYAEMKRRPSVLFTPQMSCRPSPLLDDRDLLYLDHR